MIDGVVLSDNLYSDPKGRSGFYRYKQEGGRPTPCAAKA